MSRFFALLYILGQICDNSNEDHPGVEKKIFSDDPTQKINFLQFMNKKLRNTS
jgi:hypothetical protein